MKRSGLVFLLFVLLCILAAPLAVEAQPPTNIPRIGFLTAVPLSVMSARTEAFRQGLRELGYVEGRTIVIEWRSAEGQPDRLPSLAAELVRLKVDVIVTGGPSATRSAKAATGTIPIVITNDSDPVANGFVASLARPGGNITGLSTVSPDMYGKQLELLKEIVPRLSRVAVVGDSTEPGNAQALKETERAARALRVELQYLDVHGPKDLVPAFRAASTERADAILTLPSAVLASNRKQVVELAGRSRLPAIHFSMSPGFVTDGGLISYGASTTDLDRRAATYVDRILKGAKPAHLPIEQPTKFEFIINLKAAKAMGLTIPPSVLARADEVIE
jgi:putative tryptophan/tyrosine transport system substrate-binding protein